MNTGLQAIQSTPATYDIRPRRRTGTNSVTKKVRFATTHTTHLSHVAATQGLSNPCKERDPKTGRLTPKAHALRKQVWYHFQIINDLLMVFMYQRTSEYAEHLKPLTDSELPPHLRSRDARARLHYGFRVAIPQDEHYEHQVEQWLNQLDVVDGFEANWTLNEKIDYATACIHNHVKSNSEQRVETFLNDPIPDGYNTIIMATVCTNHDGIAHRLSQERTMKVLQLIKQTLQLPEGTEPMWYFDLAVHRAE